MKRFFSFILIIQAILLFSETGVGENKFIKFNSNQDSIALYRNANFFEREVIYPEKKGGYIYKTTSSDTILAFASLSDSLIELYTVKRKNDKHVYLYLADNYSFFGMNSKAKENYIKSFESNKNEFSSYDKLIEFYSEKESDSLSIVMDAYLAKNPANINVLYKNAGIRRNMNLDYSDLIKQALPLQDTSFTYFEVLLTALYEIKDIDARTAKDAVDYATMHFFSSEDFMFVLYYVMDNYSYENFDSNLAGKLSEKLSSAINDEVKYYISSYMIDNSYKNEEALSSMKSLVGSEIYPDYGEYMLYSIAKSYLHAKEIDSAYAYAKKASDEFAPAGYDFHEMKFEICMAANDTINALDSGIKLLTYDRKNKEMFEKVVALSNSNAKSVDRKIDDYLEKESGNELFADAVLISLDDTEKKFSMYKNKVVLIDFFATWCGPCKMEIKDLVEMKKEYSKEKKISFIAVSSEDDAELIKEFAKDMSFDFDIYYNGGALMDRESIKGVPTLYLIDKKGVVRYTRVGYSEENDKYLRTRIDYLLKK